MQFKWKCSVKTFLVINRKNKIQQRLESVKQFFFFVLSNNTVVHETEKQRKQWVFCNGFNKMQDARVEKKTTKNRLQTRLHTFRRVCRPLSWKFAFKLCFSLFFFNIFFPWKSNNDDNTWPQNVLENLPKIAFVEYK